MLTSLIVSSSSLSSVVLLIISFIKNMNSTGDSGSPCFTPKSVLKKFEHLPLYHIHDLTLWYIANKAFNITLLQPFLGNFCHKKDLFTESKAFW